MYQPKSSKTSPLHENSVLTFGQYKGNPIKQILQLDPNYLQWCVENIPWFDVTPELEDLIFENVEDTETAPCYQTDFDNNFR